MDDSQRTFFVTSVTWQRLPIFRVEARARLLIEVLLGYRDQGRYLVHEFVVMPDHIHLLLTPSGEVSLEKAVQFIKGGYSYRLGKVEKIQLWQESFTSHRIRDAEDYERHSEYVRLNPVRAGLVQEATSYPFSSASPGVRLDAMPQGLKPSFSKSTQRGA
jgi:putative transposase